MQALDYYDCLLRVLLEKENRRDGIVNNYSLALKSVI